MTEATAIASPRARPRPRIIAAAIAAAGVREDDAAHHLPASRADRERPFLQLVGDAEEELTARCSR